MKRVVLAISNKFRLSLGILLALIIFQSTIQAQITASTSSYSTTTAYTVGNQNEIFVFSDEFNAGVGVLKAVSPDGTSGWTFTWTKWDSGTNTFGGSFPVSNGQESTLGNLPNGLYKVNVTKVGETPQTYQAWVINHLKNTNQPSFTKIKMDCVDVHFTSSYIAAKYQYFDFPSTGLLDLSTTPVFSFKRDGVELQRVPFPNYDGSEKNFRDDKAFEGDAEYKITVIDECGFEYTSVPILSKTYVVDAIFTFSPATGEAPLEVSFEIDKANATDYQWSFYKDFKHIPEVDYKVPAEREYLLTDIATDKDPVYTYMHPGEYMVKLIVTNNVDGMGCSKTSELSKIVVEGSIFEVPNVFTPNGDGKNDKFHLKLYSVKSYSVKIFNRWGRMVYEFEESDVSPGAANKKSSKSWDGKINGKLASPGTYFYVVEAEGREEEGKHYTERGSLTLLHDK